KIFAREGSLGTLWPAAFPADRVRGGPLRGLKRGGAAMDRSARYEGCLLGLAVGDALGTTLEFTPPGGGGGPPLTGIVGGGPFNLRPGQWTDDTSMALCLAESLLAQGGFDAADQMARYVRWWRQGENSSTGRCFNIGNATAAALARFERTGDPFAG